MAEYDYTIKTYLTNPVGVGASTLPMRAKILDALKTDYYNIRQKKEFRSRAFKVLDSIIISVEVPSSSVDNVYYDVAIEFKDGANTNNLSNCLIAVYSNSPSFVYTYAYVFNQRDLLIDALKVNLGNEPLNTPPNTRNPDTTINYEKSIVFAIFYIQDNDYLNKNNILSSIKIISKSTIKNEIRSFEQAQANYHREKANQKLLKENKKNANPKDNFNEEEIKKESKNGTKVNRVVNNRRINTKVNTKVNNRVKK